MQAGCEVFDQIPRDNEQRACGKVERLHRTLKNWLTRQPAADTITTRQAQLDTFSDYYNHQRPHRSIARRTPAQAWTARPRATPARPRATPARQVNASASTTA